MSEKRNFKVLIVDDEEDILELLKYNLEKEGYLVKTALDGREGVKIAKKFIPDLILLDIMMPKQDGVETCRQLREIPDLNGTYITFLTARSEEYSEVAAFEVGADDYITKPIKPRALMSRLKALFRREGKKKDDPNKVFNRDELLQNIWGTDVYVLARTVDVHIRKVREKIGEGFISTVKGVGYKFQLN